MRYVELTVGYDPKFSSLKVEVEAGEQTPDKLAEVFDRTHAELKRLVDEREKRIGFKVSPPVEREHYDDAEHPQDSDASSKYQGKSQYEIEHGVSEDTPLKCPRCDQTILRSKPEYYWSKDGFWYKTFYCPGRDYKFVCTDIHGEVKK